MLIYAAIGAFGLLFLLAMLFVGEIFGGDHDVHAGVAKYYDLSHPAASGVGMTARVA